MLSDHDIIRNHALAAIGVVDRIRQPETDVLRQTEWCPEFEKLMRNRLIMGCLRYGPLREKHKHKYDLPHGMRRLIADYERTGNLEFMVDLANYALLEFVVARKNGKRMRKIDDGQHCHKKT